jgi:hypothetical protein
MQGKFAPVRFPEQKKQIPIPVGSFQNRVGRKPIWWGRSAKIGNTFPVAGGEHLGNSLMN